MPSPQHGLLEMNDMAWGFEGFIPRRNTGKKQGCGVARIAALFLLLPVRQTFIKTGNSLSWP